MIIFNKKTIHETALPGFNIAGQQVRTFEYRMKKINKIDKSSILFISNVLHTVHIKTIEL